MVELSIEHILLFIIIAFLLYHFVGSCECTKEGFKVKVIIVIKFHQIEKKIVLNHIIIALIIKVIQFFQTQMELILVNGLVIIVLIDVH